MHERTDKRRLFQLIDMYLSGEMDAWTFCNEYYLCYDLEPDRETLTDIESKAFYELSIVTGRFTNIEDDLKQYPGIYFSEEQLHQKVMETKRHLEQKNDV